MRWDHVKTLAGVSLAFLLSGPVSRSRPTAATGSGDLPFPAEELIRRVALAQGRVDRSLTDYTFDQGEIRTTTGRTDAGRRPAAAASSTSRGTSRGGDRELIEVDGRPATGEEKREEAEDDAKQQRRQVERRGRGAASRPPAVGGRGGGPARRAEAPLRPDRAVRLRAVEGRRGGGAVLYALEFSPKPGLPAASLGDRALNALAGRVLVDASDLQVVSVEARLVAPVKVGGGLAANVKEATISYRGARLPRGGWFPCVVDLHLKGKTAVFFRLDTAFRFEFSGFASFSVETDSDVGGPGRPSVQSAPMTPSKRRLVFAVVFVGAFAGLFFAYRSALVPATHADHDHGILNLDAGGYLEVETRDGKGRNLVGAPGKVLVVHFVDPEDGAAADELRSLFAFQGASGRTRGPRSSSS